MAALELDKDWIKRVAQTGLISKGIVYVLLGILGFMAAFELNGHNSEEASQTGALKFVKELPAGTLLLAFIGAGLLCYSFWRGIEAFHTGDNKNKKWGKKLRYLFSGIAYVALAFTAFKLVFQDEAAGRDQNQQLAGELLSKPFGQALAGMAALAFAGIGAYQIYYGLSEKYKKHVKDLSLQSSQAKLLLRSGKIGYISRGIVWLAIAYLFTRAALDAVASEAGNTGKAFRFIEASPFGSYLLGILGLGVMAYGIFNFVRARYDHF